MAKIGVKKIVILFVVLTIVIVVFILALSKKEEPQLYEKIFLICETNDSIKIGDITEFDWDIAYVDQQNYSNGQRLKEKGIKGDFQPLSSDFHLRIAFCKGDLLVYDLVLNEYYVSIDESVTEITPETVLRIIQSPESYEQYLLTN